MMNSLVLQVLLATTVAVSGDTELTTIFAPDNALLDGELLSTPVQLQWSVLPDNSTNNTRDVLVRRKRIFGCEVGDRLNTAQLVLAPSEWCAGVECTGPSPADDDRGNFSGRVVYFSLEVSRECASSHVLGVRFPPATHNC